jgi:hypothetical protein
MKWEVVDDLQVVFNSIEKDIESSQVAKVLRRQQRLSDLGFEEAEAEAVAEALVRVGAVGRQRRINAATWNGSERVLSRTSCHFVQRCGAGGLLFSPGIILSKVISCTSAWAPY